MKKITISLISIAALSISISDTYANTPEPNNSNDCGQYGVTYQVNTVNDPDKGYRESVVVSKPSGYTGNVHATVTRERRDNSTYTTQMDSRNSTSHNGAWGKGKDDIESNSGNGDRVKSVDLQCYPNSK